eukprot:7235120-Prymnesium_polylepis.1
MVTPSSPLTDLRCSRIWSNLGPATNAMVASGMFRGCYAREFDNDVCVCTRCTCGLLTTKSGCV